MSIQTRLTRAYISFFAVALLILDLGLYFILHTVLITGIDNELNLGASLLQQAFTDSNSTLKAFFNDGNITVKIRSPSVSGFADTTTVAQIYQSDGSVVAHSPNLQTTITIDDARVQNALEGRASLYTGALGNEPLVRQMVMPLMLYNPISKQKEAVGVLLLARSLRETEDMLRIFAYALLGSNIFVLLVAASGGSWLTRSAFRPIDEVVHTAQSIVGTADLRSRVPVPQVQDELHRLTITINDLLGRLETLFNNQQRFMADVSHELRTPLAAIQGNLDVLARGALHNPELCQESIQDMRQELSRLIRMTNDLLLLARSDAGLEIRQEPVELDTLLLEVLRELRPLANGTRLQMGAEDIAIVQGDRDRLKQALLNLGINALEHTPAHGAVTLSLERRGAMVAVQVHDTGSGIQPEELPHIFDRFYRVDAARTRNRGGAGLGLSIVKWIAEAHSGEVRVESLPEQGTCFTLLLPLSATGNFALPATHGRAALEG